VRLAFVSRDLQLLRQFATTRDRDALGALYERHYVPMYRVARAFVPRHHDARDAVHGAFLVAIERCQGFRGTGSVRAWLLAITLNQSRDAQRRERPAAPSSLLEDLRSLAPPAPVVVERGEAEEELLAALRELPPKLQEPLVLHYLEDMTLAEISEVLGVPRSTLQARCERGLQELRGALGPRAKTSAFTAAFAGLINLPVSGKAVVGGVLMFWKLAACAGIVLLAWWAWPDRRSETHGDRNGTQVLVSSGEETSDAAPEEGTAEDPTSARSPMPTRAYTEPDAAPAGPWEVKGVVSLRGGGATSGLTVQGIVYPGWYESGFWGAPPAALATGTLVTEADGSFTWGLPVPGTAVTVHLEVEVVGRGKCAVDRLVYQGAPPPQDLRLEFGVRDAWVAGIVVGPDGAPVPTASVSCVGVDAHVDARGGYRIAVPGRSTGRGIVHAWAPGFAVAESYFYMPRSG
jgi:RNA polymerase sigma-70 factor (ECF subfamily)